MTEISNIRSYRLQSIGTSNLALPAFLAKLKAAQTHLLIDLRSRPQSRWFPHFNQRSLRSALESNEISYLWMGDLLGGFQEGFKKFEEYMAADPQGRFTSGIAKLLKILKDAAGPVAIMCSERDVNKCHRKAILEYVLQKTPTAKRIEVTYL